MNKAKSQFTKLTSLILISRARSIFIDNHVPRLYNKSHFTTLKSSISHFTRTNIDHSRLTKIPFPTLFVTLVQACMDEPLKRRDAIKAG
jgi:hypothetical protein